MHCSPLQPLKSCPQASPVNPQTNLSMSHYMVQLMEASSLRTRSQGTTLHSKYLRSLSPRLRVGSVLLLNLHPIHFIRFNMALIVLDPSFQPYLSQCFQIRFSFSYHSIVDPSQCLKNPRYQGRHYSQVPHDHHSQASQPDTIAKSPISPSHPLM